MPSLRKDNDRQKREKEKRSLIRRLFRDKPVPGGLTIRPAEKVTKALRRARRER